MQILQRYRSGCPLRILAFAAALTLFLSSAGAQEYEQWPLGQDRTGQPLVSFTSLNNEQPLRAKIDAMLSGSAQLSPDEFDKFFSELMFPLFTQWKEYKAGAQTRSPLLGGPRNPPPPADMRRRFRLDYASKATNAQARDRLNDMTLRKMGQIAAGNHHPICRSTAMLMIADLNETEPDGIPYKKALPVLLNAAKDKTANVVVREPALRGLLRHARAGIGDESRNQVNDGMVAILKDRNNLNGRSQEELDWTCRRAVDVLEAMFDSSRSAVAPPATAAALVDTVKDNATLPSIRCRVAEALGKIKYNPLPGVDPTALAKDLGKLAVDDAKGEVVAASSQRASIAVDRLKQHVAQIRRLLTGGGNAGLLAQSPAPAHQLFVKLLDAQLVKIDAACKTPALVQPKADASGGPVIPIDTQAPIAKAIHAACDAVEAVLQGGGAGAPAPAPAGQPEKAADGKNVFGAVPGRADVFAR